jgi:hypothetical protein
MKYTLKVRDRAGRESESEIHADSPIEARTKAGKADPKLCANEHVILGNVPQFDRQIVSLELVEDSRFKLP